MERSKNQIKLKFKKIFSTAKLPSYTKKGDAGMDLTAISLKKESGYWEYGTGLAMQVPEGYVGLLFPRSSISKTDHFLKNSVGVIDSGYRGEIKIRMSIPHLGAPCYHTGDRIAQLIIEKCYKVDWKEMKTLENSERGQGGFGSSGE